MAPPRDSSQNHGTRMPDPKRRARQPKPRRRIAFAAASVAAIAVMLFLISAGGGALELPARDLAMRSLPSRPAVATAVLAIDEPSLRALGPWPWPRPLLARLVDAAADAGATAMIIDVLLAEEREGDQQLARALRRLPSIAVAVLDENGRWVTAAPAIAGASTAAHGNFELDHDAIVRRFASTKQNTDRSLAAVAIEAAAVKRASLVPVGRALSPAFRTRPHDVPLLSAVSLLQSPAGAAQLRGKLVFLGPTALGLGDRVLTPVSGLRADPGVTVHAAATESLLRNEELREASPLLAGCCAAVAVWLLVRTRNRRRLRAAMAMLLLLLVIGGGMWLLARAQIAIPFATLLLTVAGTVAVDEAMLVTAAMRESRAAVARIESGLGVQTAVNDDDLAPRIEELAQHLAARRARDAESQRVLAHELRTPLTSMRNLTQLLGGFELTEPERRRVTSLLEAEAGKLQLMVHELLELERLPLRELADSATLLDVSAVTAARIDFLRASADRPLVATIEPRVSIRGDAALIERVLDNLVGNALKYAPPDMPISIRLQRLASTAVLEVEDRGRALGDEERQRLFERFFRGSTAAGTQGLGLGLSLVAEVARWHGGSVALDRAADGGTLFRVSLPAVDDVMPDGVRA